MFVLKDDNTLVEMRPATFALESDFQQLLEKFPALLSGEEIDRESPRRWILVAREKTVPSDEGGAARWYVDHLFLDQDGIPTIVEVKRQSDSRIRREVVGQMLDYAANGVAYWPVEEIKSHFESTCQSANRDSNEDLRTLLNPDDDADSFWARVKTNLQAGKVRMLFVADVIPPELRKIVEFLNKQMDPAEVLALELKQFEGEGGLRTLVPRLYGQTQESQQRKGVTAVPRSWDEPAVYSEIERRHSSDVLAVAKEIMKWMKENADTVSFGHGKVDGSVSAIFKRNDKSFNALYLSTTGRISVNFAYCLKAPFDDPGKRLQWLKRLNQIQGVNLSDDAIDKFPTILLSKLKSHDQLQKFFSAMSWFLEEISVH